MEPTLDIDDFENLMCSLISLVFDWHCTNAIQSNSFDNDTANHSEF